MSKKKGEYLRDQGDIDLANDDYVVLDSDRTPCWEDGEFIVNEHILTFSGITIKRSRLIHASDAKAKKGSEDSEEGLEELQRS